MILLVDNYDSFTWNLVQRLGEIDRRLAPDRDLVVIRNDKITPASADALDSGRGPTHVIISPGPCTPAEAGNSADIINHYAGRVPVMGVCLGHQCIGAMHGMQITQHPRVVHGKTSPVHHDNQGLFEGLPNPFMATRYHSLVIDADTIPKPPEPGQDGFIVSAWTDDDIDGQAVRVVQGLRRVWAEDASGSQPKLPLEGVQFHPESFLTDAGPQLLANFLRLAPAFA